jgi:hypothetical protein
MRRNEEEATRSMIDEQTLKAAIARVAAAISTGPLGLALHRPEQQARSNRSFRNVADKVLYDGGAPVHGWTFSYRSGDDIPEPGYLLASHHAVWHSPDGRLVDVTPYPKAALRPISPGEDTLFLVDAGAKPTRAGKRFIPLPSRAFALSEDAALAAHVEALNREAEEEWRRESEATPSASG